MGVKKTTAQEAAEKIDDLDLPESIRLDLPDRLKAAAAAFFEQLDEQPYWQDIDDTTRDDVFFMLRSAIENGTSIRDVAKSISSNTDYADYRAKRIARTEIGGAMNAGHEAGIRALADESGLALTKEWLSVMGPTTRAAHAEADGQEVGASDLFLVDDENTPYPGHWSMSAGNRCNCQCLRGDATVAGIGSVEHVTRMLYSGQMIEVVTLSGRRLNVTPNHPVLTRDGWKAAKRLQEGDYLLRVSNGIGFGSTEDHANSPVSIEQLFESCAAAVTRIEHSRRNAFEFHGDAQFGVGEIDVVRTARDLSLPSYAKLLENSESLDFDRGSGQVGCLEQTVTGVIGLVLPAKFLGGRSGPDSAKFLEQSLDYGITDVVFGSQRDHRLAGQVSGQNLGFRENDSLLADMPYLSSGAAQGAASVAKILADCGSVSAEGLADADGRLTGLVEFDEICHVSVSKFFGHVFNLSSESGAFVASEYIVHNCTVISGILSEALDTNLDSEPPEEDLAMEDTGSEDARWMDELSDEDDRRRQLLLVDTGEDDADEATLAEQQQAELDAAAEIADELQQKLEAELAETIAQATEEANSQIDKPPKKPGKEFDPDKDYNPDQPRDELGRWTDAGGGSGSDARITLGAGDEADKDKPLVLGPEDEMKPAKPSSLDDEVIVLTEDDEVATTMDHIPQVEHKPPLPNPIDDEVIVLTADDEVKPEEKPLIIPGPRDEVNADGLIVLRDEDEDKPKKKPPRQGGLPG